MGGGRNITFIFNGSIDMKLSPTLLFLVAMGLIFVFTPFIPSSVLKMAVGTGVGSLVLLVFVLLVLQKDVVLGLAAFLAVASLFLENRRRIVEHVQTKMLIQKEKPSTVKELNIPAPDLVPGEIHPPRKDAEVDDYGFEPSEDTGKDKFEVIDETINEKQPLETVPPQPSEVSEMLQQKGFANIS